VTDVSRRSAIRLYAQALFKNSCAVSSRVFHNRSVARLLETELPAISLSLASGKKMIIVGNESYPKTYKEEITLWVTVVTSDVADAQRDDCPGVLIHDALCESVSDAMANDRWFSKLLPGYDPDDDSPGLLMFSVEETTDFDVQDLESGAQVSVSEIAFRLGVQWDHKVSEQWAEFYAFLIGINRVGWTEATIDPTLISGGIQ
jgi:hypothetical protein